MVQLPATAAIEYVAAPGGHGGFWPGGFLFGVAFVLGVFCPGAYASSTHTSPGLAYRLYSHIRISRSLDIERGAM